MLVNKAINRAMESYFFQGGRTIHLSAFQHFPCLEARLPMKPATYYLI